MPILHALTFATQATSVVIPWNAPLGDTLQSAPKLVAPQVPLRMVPTAGGGASRTWMRAAGTAAAGTAASRASTAGSAKLRMAALFVRGAGSAWPRWCAEPRR